MNGPGLEVALLGPLTVRGGARTLCVPAGRQRILLATLVLRAGQAVSMDDIVDRLWDGDPPGAASTTVRGHVKRLRRALGGSGSRTGSAIESCAGGYRLNSGEVRLDVDEFHRLLSRAGAAGADDEEASGLLDRALRLWRGTPLSDIRSDSLRRETVPALEEERLRAVHRRIGIDLRRGTADRWIPELRALLARDALQEHFWEQLMHALHLCGRHAEALREYERCRRLLGERLGVNPGPALRRAHGLILTGRTVPAGDIARTANAVRPAVAVPRRFAPQGSA